MASSILRITAQSSLKVIGMNWASPDLRELLGQRRAFPVEAEEGLLDLLLQLRREVVDDAVAGRREGLRLVDRLELILGLTTSRSIIRALTELAIAAAS